ncbi:ImcF-related family protein [uncultured Sulfitobacter sp.]|uniref:ImcF-related family protein n=1 Tax=uncultured Sulfitobacter sp. TaxID=191468 RepID=UPI0030D72D8B|tara:strand:+ start:31905 stop:35564 length:3660 start_codon:yes stop_codon:yes gene_type:complete
MNWTKIIKIALVAFLLVMVAQLGGLLFTWYSGTPFSLGRYIWLGLILGSSLIVAILALVFRSKIWVSDPVLAKLRSLRQLAKKQFRQARSRANTINKSPDSVPWYLFLAMQKDTRSTLMAELGYVIFGDPVTHKGLVFTTWVSPTAVAYRIEIDATKELSFDLLDIVQGLLFKNRPNMAVNAAFVEYELADLMQSAATETGNITTINRILNVVADSFGMDIPVHVSLTGLEHMPDLARAAMLTGQMGSDAIFGGFLTTEKTDLNERIDSLFEDMIRALNTEQLSSLQKQITPEYCAALLNAPFQLSLLQAQVKSRMAILTQARPPRTHLLNLQSIAFVGGRTGMGPVDPLSQVACSRFFNGAPLLIPRNDMADSVTIENAGLLASAYHRERFGVEQNRRYSVQRSFNATLWSLTLCGLVALFSFLVWDNYRSYAAVNDRLEAAFDQYFNEAADLTTDSDFLVKRVLSLQPLRDGLDGYDALNEYHHRRLLPNWSMEEMYQGLYETELTGGLQASLINFLEKEIFAYNSLQDGVELIRLASVEVQIYEDQETHKSELTEYFSKGLNDEGEVSGVFQSQLRATLGELFTLNQPPQTRNEELRKVVIKTLSALDSDELIYKSLMRRSTYAERVDLRQMIGPRFFEVFVPMDDAQAYLVPRGYTRSGFNLLFDEGSISGLSTMINNYADVVGMIDSARENAIIRGVSQRYTADYISRWSTFLSSLSLREAESWSDAQILMDALTNPSENPIDRLAAALTNNADIKVFLPPPPAADAAVPAAGAAPAPPDAAPQLAPASASLEAAAAYNIRTAFQPYLDALRAEGDQKSQFDLFLSYARDVNRWLEEAASASNGPGAFLFEQFQKAESTNPLAVLNSLVVRSELDIIRDFGRSIASTLDESAMGFVYDYIDGQWHDQILSLHGASLTRNFPFDASSANDMPLDEFADLFAPEGKLQTFEKTYLSRFKTQSGVFLSRGTFLLTGRAEVSAETNSAFRNFGQIAEVMFVDGKPYLDFELRPGLMAPDLSNLSITSGVTLLQFAHGPVLWTKQQWPVAGIKDSDLTLRIFRRSRALINDTFTGPWSWFRLVHSGTTSLNPSLGVAETVFSSEAGNVTLQLEATVRFNPFGPGFFSNIELPATLFNSKGAYSAGQVDGELIEILRLWLARDPVAEKTLIEQRGRSLDIATRSAIQRRLQIAGHYGGQIDGIFGRQTRTGLVSWRNALQ